MSIEIFYKLKKFSHTDVMTMTFFRIEYMLNFTTKGKINATEVFDQ